ncbi:lasso peptide biosynthesis B2 protein [Streptomyces sp. NPDC049627]|uniref:lasso peptide biosynthesis B2 protein n=1 Tax=Streptomyces sp. NPDC049627 TaxID=3365595 RepID=UPI00379B1DAD
MTSAEVIVHDPRSVPLPRRVLVRLAVALARLLAGRRPRRIRIVLGRLGRGARPATVDQARRARDDVVAVSLACAGREGCVARSLATVLLCRMHGQWPTWCVGARRLPPFGAHAWVEAEGVAVGEEYPADYFRPLFTVECGGAVSRKPGGFVGSLDSVDSVDSGGSGREAGSRG